MSFWLPPEQQRLEMEQQQEWEQRLNHRAHRRPEGVRKQRNLKHRGKAPGPIEFLGKDAASTLAFNHKSGLDRMGMSRWYASSSSDLVRNVPSIEKRWLQEADASLKHGAAPLDLDVKGDNGNGDANALRGLRIATQKKQIARRMRENLSAQSKIVLNLLPRR